MTQDKFPHCILHTAASGSKPKLPTTLQALLSSDFAGLPNPTKTQLATIPPWKFSTKTVLGEYAIHISASSLLSGLRSGIFKPGKLPHCHQAAYDQAAYSSPAIRSGLNNDVANYRLTCKGFEKIQTGCPSRLRMHARPDRHPKMVMEHVAATLHLT
jgi:hypothetical protein